MLKRQDLEILGLVAHTGPGYLETKLQAQPLTSAQQSFEHLITETFFHTQTHTTIKSPLSNAAANAC